MGEAIARLEGNLIRKSNIMHALGARGVSIIQKRISSGKFAPDSPLTRAVKGGDKVLRDRGQLYSGIAFRVEGDTIIIGTNHPAAKILHLGGTIRPKNAKYLALPAGAKTRTLMRQYGLTPRACIEGMKADGYSVWFNFARGGANIMARKGKKGQLFLLFILKRSVTLPARPFMSLGEDGKEQLLKTFREEMMR